MARGFGSTLGAGVNDVVASRFQTAQGNGQRSYAVWALIRTGGVGGGRFPRLFNNNNSPALNVGEEAAYVSPTGTFGYARNWNSIALWEIAAPTTGVWHHFCITYDAASTANAPVIYQDGTSRTVTTVAAAVGTIANTPDFFRIGNSSLVTEWWDGLIAHFAIWDKVLLTAGEVLALASGVSPVLIRPDSLKTYLPINGIDSPETDFILGNAANMTGTLLTQNEPPLNQSLNRYATFNTFMNSNFIYVNPVPTPAPPPTNLPYVIGTGMVQQGTSILLQGTAPLINKGTVRDQRNIIPH